MKKLELKHIVGYLPYCLKAVKGVTRIEITSISLELPHVYHTSYLGSRLRVVSKIEDIKPILRPLSDLTKEIEVNVEKFVPINWFDENIFPKHNSPAVCFTDGYVEMCYFKEYEKLYEWHFDIHGLIEKGLAIDINTIDNGIQ